MLVGVWRRLGSQETVEDPETVTKTLTIGCLCQVDVKRAAARQWYVADFKALLAKYPKFNEETSGGGFTIVDASFCNEMCVTMVHVEYCRALLEALPSAKLRLRTDGSYRLSREGYCVISLGVLLRNPRQAVHVPRLGLEPFACVRLVRRACRVSASSNWRWAFARRSRISLTACCCRAFSMSRPCSWAWTCGSMSSASMQICIQDWKRHGWVCSAGVAV